MLTISYVCLGDRLLCKQFHQSTDDGESSTDWSENIDFQCKEEEDQYIPIMEITSVCSMASNAITSEQSVRRRTMEVYWSVILLHSCRVLQIVVECVFLELWAISAFINHKYKNRIRQLQKLHLGKLCIFMRKSTTLLVCILYVKQKVHFIQCLQPENHRQMHYYISYICYLKKKILTS